MTLVIVLAELLLRLAGFQPWTHYPDDINEPTFHEFDPVLGWKLKAGKYVIPAYKPSEKDIQMTLLPGGRRDAGAKEEGTDEGELVILGGSFTLGLAISDEETYPWKLQTRFPPLKVMNYGTDGYGSYQSLLVLERELPLLRSPAIVLYGFFQHHEERNVAPGGWLEMLSKYSRRQHVYLPYATIDESGILSRHEPERYPEVPYMESLSTITFLVKVYMKLKTMDRFSQRREVTEKILIDMNRISDAYGAKLVVTILAGEEEWKNHYMDFLKANDIEVVDCVRPITRELRVPGEGHPNEKMNSLWAECIAKRLERLLNVR